MSENKLIENTLADSDDVLAASESAVEAKRAAARRWFLSRGAAGAGLVVLTIVHRRANAQSPFNPNAHVLSLDRGTARQPASPAAVAACQSLFGPGATAQAHQTIEGQSFFVDDPQYTVYYCVPPNGG